VDRVFGWLAEYSYACVLIAAAIDAMALPFPGRLVLLSAGILAAAGHVDLLGTIAAGLGGAVAGDHLWYFGGRLARGRLHAFHRWLARRRVRPATDPAAYLRRYGGLVILIGRFIATVRVLVWPIASAHGIGYRRFLAWDFGAAALWAGAFVLGGYAFGRPALTLQARPHSDEGRPWWTGLHRGRRGPLRGWRWHAHVAPETPAKTNAESSDRAHRRRRRA
jgi:membrane-associated protein